MTQEMLFDVAELAQAAVAATPWEGRAPLAYTTSYHTPDDLDAAYTRWIAEHGEFGCIVYSHMWHRAIAAINPITRLNGHELHPYNAEGRCHYPDQHDHSNDPEPLPGRWMYQAICPSCSWHHIGTENNTVEAWHDHALPGWRELPVLPATLAGLRDTPKGAPRIRAWIEEHYPDGFAVDGAPILTDRGHGGSRHVPGRSPLGGYDLAAPPNP